MIRMLDVATIVIAGIMVGTEFSVAALIHPTLARLEDRVHLGSSVALARILGSVMPFWYALVLFLMVAEDLVRHHLLHQWPCLVSIAAILWAVSIVYTLAALVPINNRIASWTESTSPANWMSERHRWDVLHRWRVGLLVASFTLFVIAALAYPLI